MRSFDDDKLMTMIMMMMMMMMYSEWRLVGVEWVERLQCVVWPRCTPTYTHLYKSFATSRWSGVRWRLRTQVTLLYNMY